MRWAISTRPVYAFAAAVGLGVTGLAPTTGSAPRVPPQGAVPDLAGNGWVKVLDENFNGSSLDESIWHVPEGPAGTTGYRSRDALQVANGNLTIRTFSEDRDGNGAAENFTGSVLTSIEDPVEAGGDRRPGFQATYGYFEARVRLDNQRGTRSAFWLMPAETATDSPLGDAAAGGGPEIDIFEVDHPQDGDSNPADGRCDGQLQPLPCNDIAGGSLHWNGYEENRTSLAQQVPWTGNDPQGHFLTYGLLWTPDGYRIYRDGVEVFHSSEGSSYRPEYLLLTNYFNAGFVPADGYGPRSGASPTMTVDYVQVWQRPISPVPDQSVGINSAVAVPFSVTDHLSSSSSGTVRPTPGGVWVTASSDNQALVPNGQLLVSGNLPSFAPDGTFTNRGFESGSTGWSLTDASGTDSARIWSTRKRSGSSSLRLEQAGGRAEQTISGLLPNTTYVVSGWYNLELCYTDSNGDGRITWNGDANGDGWPQTTELEPLSGPSCGTPGDGNASFDWGVKDVDGARAGDQAVTATHSRNVWQEAKDGWWAPTNGHWAHSTLTFTTGPTTTNVVLYVDNLVYRSTPDAPHDDSDLSFDDVTIRPVVPPNRTVVVRPRDGASGSAKITLTANDLTRPIGQQLIGTETFTVQVSEGSSFQNGDFEQLPAGVGWELHGDPAIEVEDPFTGDRAAHLAESASDTVIQRIGGLTAGRQYELDVHARLTPSTVAGNPNNIAVGISNATGSPAQVTANITETTPGQAATLRFTPTSSTANLVILDWAPTDGSSVVDDVDFQAVQPVAPTNYSAPPLSAAEMRLSSSSPAARPFTVPPGTTITAISSDNPDLFPRRNLAASVYEDATYKGRGVVSLTPVANRTGKATVTVTTSTGTYAIPVVVSDEGLRDPGFEQRPTAWTFDSPPAGAAITAGGERRSGNAALTLNGTGKVTQTLSGLDFNTPYAIKGWVKGAVKVTAATVPDDHMTPPEVFESTVSSYWLSGGQWTENLLGITTTQCAGPEFSCQAAGGVHEIVDGQPVIAPGGQVRITLEDAMPNDGQPVYVDDLRLEHTPRVDPLREVSINQSQTDFDWDTRTNFSIGRVSANTLWDPQSWSIGSSNTGVLPLANLRLVRSKPFWEHSWSVEARAEPNAALSRTGRSTVTFTLNSPGSPGPVQRTFGVTINAGSFNQGSFTYGTKGWTCGWCFSEQGWQVVDAQGTRQIGPIDKDQVLRLSSGVVAYRVTGLQPGTRYALNASAVGNGATVRVVAPNPDRCTGTGAPANAPCHWFWGTQRGNTIRINSPTWAMTPNLVFDTQSETEVWIFVQDDQMDSGADDPPCSSGTTPCDSDTMNDPVPARRTPCVDDDGAGPADSVDGETCIDEIGLFLAADVDL
jgi:beta-glucanase (GH16 family)